MAETAPTLTPTIDTPPDTEPYLPPSGDWNIMTETDLPTVLREIEEGVRHYDNRPSLFLNNMADSLPGGRRREAWMRHKYPKTVADKYMAAHGPKQLRHNAAEWNDWQTKAHGPRMADATFGDLHSDIETAIAAAATKNPDITRANLVALNWARTEKKGFVTHPQAYIHLLSPAAQKVYAADPEHFDRDLLNEAFAFDLLSVYAELRTLNTGPDKPVGYTHYDLYQ